jgi:integrase
MTRRQQKPRKTQAVLEEAEIKRVRAAAKADGPLAHALIEWLYTNGARASEPGLARTGDVDLHTGTVMLAHLKGGLAPKPVPMAESLRKAMKAWMSSEEFRLKPVPGYKPDQAVYVFPSANPLPCYPCKGTKRFVTKSRRRGGADKIGPCPHCHATGTRWGMTRHEVDRVVTAVMRKAGIPEDYCFPHILRHSAVTHLLNGRVPPPAIQERVGHKSLATTYGYMHTTKKARAQVTKVFDTEDDDE